ncbi:D-galactarate dehydratase [Roseinatronobacter sp.]|uniref:D-galactarate dehydratase n=1 Tax=Roseinatronobacter sp. TaxID=1945755 RepID=UPI003F708ED2
MKTLLRKLFILLPVLALPACGQFTGPFGQSAPERGEPAAVAQVADGQTPRPVTRPDGDSQGADAPAAPLGPVASGQVLGDTLAGLGAPTDTGLWLRTGLVTQVMQGRVRAPDGTTAMVELRPSGAPAGAGSQLSLDGFRALGVPLTQLVRLEVSAR